MSILDEMLAIRDKLEVKDRQDAMNVMVWLLRYEVAFRLGDDESFVLFRNENDIGAFCRNNNVKVSAMKWLIDNMRAEGLIGSEALPVIITPLGVEKLCRG